MADKKPKARKDGLETIHVVDGTDEKDVPPPSFRNSKMWIGMLLGGLLGFALPLGSVLAFMLIGGVAGGWAGKREMTSEYADALRFRDRKKADDGEKLGRSAEKILEIEAKGLEMGSAPDHRETSQVEQLRRRESRRESVSPARLA